MTSMFQVAYASIKCKLLGHKVHHTRIVNDTSTPCACCGAAILDQSHTVSRVAHTLSCFFGSHHYVSVARRAAHNEYICEKCGHPLLLECARDPYSSDDKFKKRVSYLCGLFGHRVHVVETGSKSTEYACQCGHSFLKGQRALTVIRHPLTCVAFGHHLTVNEIRGEWAEYLCLRCGHPFCFRLATCGQRESGPQPRLHDDDVQTDVQARSPWLNYVALIRFHYHCSFVGILLGALIVTRNWPGLLLWRIFLLYASMNVLLYGGLYSLNAITDAEADSHHPLKQTRPVASGEISRKAAGVFAAALIVAGFVTGWAWLGFESMPVYVLLLALNLSYSLCFRNLFALDVIFNSATHPPRFWLGMWLGGGAFAWEWLVLVFLFAIGMSASRRSVDLSHGSWKSRRSLPKYSRLDLLVIKTVAFGAIVLLWIVSRPTFQIPYIVTVGAYVVCVGGIEVVPRIRSVFERLWLR
jgi:4-hydroxybenzoate polyprenyltransferase